MRLRLLALLLLLCALPTAHCRAGLPVPPAPLLQPASPLALGLSLAALTAAPFLALRLQRHLGAPATASLHSRAPAHLPPTCRALDTSQGTLRWPHFSTPEGHAPTNAAGIAAVWRVELCLGGDARALLPAGGLALPAESYVPSLPPGTRVRCGNGTDLACQGALVVTRLQGCPVGPACHSGSSPALQQQQQCGGGPLLAPDAQDVPPALLKAAWDLGPDELWVFLEGPEFLRPAGTHVGGCKYIFPFAATLPGTYRAVALALRSSWGALNETGALRAGQASPGDTHLAAFPPMHLDNLLGDRFLLPLGGAASGAFKTAAAEAARAAVVLESQGAPALPQQQPPLPLCSKTLHGPSPPGRFVRTDSTALDFDPPAPWYYSPLLIIHPKLSNDPPIPAIPDRSFPGGGTGVGLKYFSKLPTSLQWVPYACAAPPLPLGYWHGCLAETGVTLRGDSQLRALFNGLLSHGCRTVEQFDRHGEDYCLESTAWCAATMSACLRWDPMGAQLPAPAGEDMCNVAQCKEREWAQQCQAWSWRQFLDCSRATTADSARSVTLVNWGQWPASGHYHYSLGRYVAELQAYSEGLQGSSSSSSRARAFWVETLPHCPRNDALVHGYRDWRTPHRIELFRRAAAVVLAPLVASGRLAGIIQVAHLADPLADLCPDSAHTTSQIIVEPMVEAMLHHICSSNVTVEGA